jgi:predicted cupin superfamily sugar epimerase
MSADQWIEHLELSAHPEGGYFRETYRAHEVIPQGALPARFAGDRAYGTSIYFLLKSGEISALHRIASDEIWHFYAGTALIISVIDATGVHTDLRLGANPESGESFQHVVPAGCWFGAHVDAQDSFALVGCTVAPGFDFNEFAMGKREKLLEMYPQHGKVIEQLTISA